MSDLKKDRNITPIAEHPYVDAIYWWFSRGGLDAARFEQEEGETKLSWAVSTESGLRISHCLTQAENSGVDFRTQVILGKVTAEDLEKVKREVLKLNVEFPCLYRFAVDKEGFLFLQICGPTETVSKGSYMSMLEGLLTWADRSREQFKSKGFG